MMDASWGMLSQLANQHGDSYFHVDVDAFRANFSEFSSAFRLYYPRTEIGYSYKTNYLPRICRLVHELGGYAEVVSGMEYQLARRLGVPAERIIFNGPYKPRRVLETALLDGAICNLDSVDEFAVVEDVCTRFPGCRLTIGLRCNIDLGADRPSRFGFDVDSTEFAHIVDRLHRLPGCDFAGLHVHANVGGRTAVSYELRIKALLDLADRCFQADPPRFLDIGGGFFGKMDDEFRAQFAGDLPSYEQYAAAIAPQMAARYGASGPELILEPGTALTADVMTFVARVMATKTVRGHRFALVAGSVHNIKPTGHGKAMPMSVVRRDRTIVSFSGQTDVVGYTCMEHDVLTQGVEAQIDVGDFVVYRNVGAYTIVMQPPFIQPAPPVLARAVSTGEVEVLRRREAMDDVFATYGL